VTSLHPCGGIGEWRFSMYLTPLTHAIFVRYADGQTVRYVTPHLDPPWPDGAQEVNFDLFMICNMVEFQLRHLFREEVAALEVYPAGRFDRAAWGAIREIVAEKLPSLAAHAKRPGAEVTMH
jgi:hypothetical protein